MNYNIKNFAIINWIKSFVIYIMSIFLVIDFTRIEINTIFILIYKSFIPLIVCIILCRLMLSKNNIISRLTPYILFFSVTFASYLGISKTLTGSHSESSTVALYGLSFYSASLAYIYIKNKLTKDSAFFVSNPLLIITGPIATTFVSINYRNIEKRFYYYFPFVILGIYLHQVIATPLTECFDIIEKTDGLSVLIFAIIFEIFVYTNFCGLSLIIYGLLGIIGFKIALNFRQPFSSTNLIDFWKGWHISISAVLKELFLKPVKKVFGTNVAILTVFISSALWHGVSLNFIIWGLFHASCFILTVYLLKNKIKNISFILLLIAVPFARILSSDSNSSRLFEKLHFRLLDTEVLSRLDALSNTAKLSVFLGLIFIIMEFSLRKYKYFRGRRYKFYRLPCNQILLLTITLMLISNFSGLNYAVYGQR